MTEDEALDRLMLLVLTQAFGWHVVADRLMPGALDALLAAVTPASGPDGRTGHQLQIAYGPPLQPS